MIDLRNKIRKVIEEEISKGHFKTLDNGVSVALIQRILEDYEKTNSLKQDFSELPKKAELIFIAAPTGAGKDTLVRKLNYDNPDKKYIELNMDIFRQYFYIFIEDLKTLSDKSFASMTNQFSYEIYYTIQEILLSEFPGTNIIITGTLRETDWVEEVFNKFKSNKNTEYNIKLACLAVPKRESAISVIQRYIGIIDVQKSRKDFHRGTARYTSMNYHDETFDRFVDNLKYFEERFIENPNELIDCIEVYRRCKDIHSIYEDTKVYSSDDCNESQNALETVVDLRSKQFEINREFKEYVLNMLLRNSGYLKEQDTLSEVFENLLNIFEYNKNPKDKELIFNLVMKNSKILKSQGTLRDIIRELAIVFNYPHIIYRLNQMPSNEDGPDLI